MGIDYRIELDETDHRIIKQSASRDDPKSIEELLTRLPGYIQGTEYEYKNDTGGWNCSIKVNGYNLHVHVYRSASEEPIIQSLFSYLIWRCGRFRIEDE